MTIETFEYAGPYKTRERAEQVLEDCFATGDIVEGERPEITYRNTGFGDGKGRYFIRLTYVS